MLLCSKPKQYGTTVLLKSKPSIDLKEKNANPVLPGSKSAREQREPAAPHGFVSQAQQEACKGKGPHQPGPVPQRMSKDARPAQGRQVRGDEAGPRLSQEVDRKSRYRRVRVGPYPGIAATQLKLGTPTL